MWDQGVMMHAVRGELWPGFKLTEETGDAPPDEGLVVIGSGAILRANGDTAVRQMIARAPWAVVVATSDEELAYDSSALRASNVKTWLQSPRPDMKPCDRPRLIGWPEDTRRIIADHGARFPLAERQLLWSFTGQGGHRARESMFGELAKRNDGVLSITGGFGQGLPRPEYFGAMLNTAIAPCPSGPHTPDTLRLYEAIEAGCLPIVEMRAPEWRTGGDYWSLACPGERPPLVTVHTWNDVHELIDGYALDPVALQRHANAAGAWWLRYKRQTVHDLSDDMMRLSGEADIREGVAIPRTWNTENHKVTVVISTSPIPSHPSTAGIEDTIRRIRAYPELVDAEVIVACDGVRPEQAHRAADYEEYRRRLLDLCNWHPDFRGCLIVMAEEHQHQAVMARRALELVRTPLVFMVEGDTYPLGEIDFAGIFRALGTDGVNAVRLHIYESVIDEHRHLYGAAREIAGVPLVRTWAWSQRPHVARTGWYRDLLATHFTHESRALIEHVMYGVVLAGGEADADRWGIWLYAPAAGWPGGILRSGTANGRGDDPLYGERFRYPGQTPPGAPQPR